MKPEQVHGSELKLGDELMLWQDHAYGSATVKKITPEFVVLFRPFVQTGDYEYTGGVPCYVGIEEFFCGKNSMFLRTRRGDPLR